MNATRSVSERLLTRIKWPNQHGRNTIPLPPRRERLHGGPVKSASELWWGREVHPEIHGSLRSMAELILWLLAVLAMIWLFAQFWS